MVLYINDSNPYVGTDTENLVSTIWYLTQVVKSDMEENLVGLKGSYSEIK